jgi:hypothetical protein
MLEQIDYLNFQFTFKYYLYKNNIDHTVCDYLENNNMKGNYICFYSEIINDAHYLVTTKLDRDTNNGYRIITIVKNNECIASNNFTLSSIENLVVHYDNYIISISNMLELDIIEKTIIFNVHIIFNLMNKYLKGYTSAATLYMGAYKLYDKNLNIDLIQHVRTHNLSLAMILPNIITFNFYGNLADIKRFKQEVKMLDSSQVISKKLIIYANHELLFDSEAKN